jgi:hypothetical protein
MAVPTQTLQRLAVSQTNGIGAEQQRLGGHRKRDASEELLRASAGSARLTCLDAERCSWRSITNNFRSVTFVKQPPSNAAMPTPTCCAPAMPCKAAAPARRQLVAASGRLRVSHFADIAGAGRANRAYAQVEHQRAVQRFWIRRIAEAPKAATRSRRAEVRTAQRVRFGTLASGRTRSSTAAQIPVDPGERLVAHMEERLSRGSDDR